MISKLKLNSSLSSIISTNQTNIKWNNIDLRVLLGSDVYSKYNIFKLTMTSVSCTNTAEEYLNNQNASAVNINISGLPFINATYSHKEQKNKDSCSLVMYHFPPLGDFTYSKVSSYDENTAVYFRKSGNNYNINIFLTNGLTDELITYKMPDNDEPVFPYMIFMFNIEPVE